MTPKAILAREFIRQAITGVYIETGINCGNCG